MILIGRVEFDTITPFETFSKIVWGLLEAGVEIEIAKVPNYPGKGKLIPEHGNWQLILRERSDGEES